MEISAFKSSNEFQKFSTLQSGMVVFNNDLVQINPSTIFACTFLVLGKYDYPKNHESYISGNFVFKEGFKNKSELIEKLIYLQNVSIKADTTKTKRYIIDASLRLFITIFNSHPDMELLKTINGLLLPLQQQLAKQNQLINS